MRSVKSDLNDSMKWIIRAVSVRHFYSCVPCAHLSHISLVLHPPTHNIHGGDGGGGSNDDGDNLFTRETTTNGNYKYTETKVRRSCYSWNLSLSQHGSKFESSSHVLRGIYPVGISDACSFTDTMKWNPLHKQTPKLRADFFSYFHWIDYLLCKAQQWLCDFSQQGKKICYVVTVWLCCVYRFHLFFSRIFPSFNNKFWWSVNENNGHNLLTHTQAVNGRKNCGEKSHKTTF